MRYTKEILIVIFTLVLFKLGAQVDYVSIQVKSSYTASFGTQHTKLVNMIPNYTPVTDGTDDFTRYGTNKYLRTDSTGFFYVKKLNGRWWMVDPNGYAGINMAVTSFSSSNVQNDYDLVRNLGYNGTGNFLSSDGQTMSSYNPVNYSLFSYTRKLNFFAGYKNVRYTSSYYPNTPTIAQGSVDYLTVFDPKFVTYCDGLAKSTAQTAVNERDLIGYFTDNELNFNQDQLYNLVHDLAAGDPSRDSALVYATSKGLTEADVMNQTAKLTSTVKQGFAAAVAAKYFQVAAAAIRKYDTKHLILGSRLHGEARSLTGVVAASQKYMDVTSVNFYDKYSPADQIALTSWTNDKPCLVTEFYIKDVNVFSATQSGAGWYVNSQAMRGDWYQNTCIDLLKSKCFIGWQYFRFQDDTDSNKGIVDGSGKEYTDMTGLMGELNKQVYHLCDFYDAVARRPVFGIKTKVLTASEDVYEIPGATSTTNYGTATELQIENNAREASIRETFLKFNLLSLKDSLQYLKHAQLDVYCTQSDAVIRSIYVGGLLDSSWGEMTLNGAIRNLNTEWKSSNNRLDSYKSAINVGNLTFDVTTWVNDQCKKGTASFKIQDLTLSNSSISIASREYADISKRPKLTLSFYDPNSTDVQQLKNTSENRLSANPASSSVTILGNDVAGVEILNLNGQMIFRTNQTRIDLTAFPKGLYLVRMMTTSGNSIVNKLMVQ